MGNICDKGALVFTVLVDFIRHIIQSLGKISQFIFRLHRNPVGKIAIGVFCGSFADLFHGGMDPFPVTEKKESAQGIHYQENHLKDSKKTTALLIKLLHFIMQRNIAQANVLFFSRIHNTEIGLGIISVKGSGLVGSILPICLLKLRERGLTEETILVGISPLAGGVYKDVFFAVQKQDISFFCRRKDICELFQMAYIFCSHQIKKAFIGNKLGSTLVKSVTQFVLQVGFHKMGSPCSGKKKSNDPNENINGDQFLIKRFFHSLLTSNLQPIPQTVERDQRG